MLYTLELHRNNRETGEYFTFIHDVVADNLFEAGSELLKIYKNKYKENYKNYILSTIKTDNNGKEITNNQDKIDYLFNRFYSEYDWSIKRNGKLQAMIDWLQGLALDIEYYNYDILELAKMMGSVDKNLTEKQEDKIVLNYWNFMANIILSMEKDYKNRLTLN